MASLKLANGDFDIYRQNGATPVIQAINCHPQPLSILAKTCVARVRGLHLLDKRRGATADADKPASTCNDLQLGRSPACPSIRQRRRTITLVHVPLVAIQNLLYGHLFGSHSKSRMAKSPLAFAGSPCDLSGL